MEQTIPAGKIAVIGAGSVGATTAYTLMLKNLGSEIVLIDVNEAKEEGEVLDIHDALPFVETSSIRGGDYKDAADADVIIVTAGLAQKSGETRLDLVNKNREIVKAIFTGIGQIKPSAIVIMVTNPVDLMTVVAEEISGLQPNQVIGTGTGLDTARMKAAVGKALGIQPGGVEGYVLGEHGDSGFIAWSTVSAGGKKVRETLGEKTMSEIETKVKQEVYEIISRKGATFYGIAMVITNLAEAILLNQNKVIPVSAHAENWNGVSGVRIGMPAVINHNGIKSIWPLELEPAEKEKLAKSATTLKSCLGTNG
jgi:L-lactate dehydrogenase